MTSAACALLFAAGLSGTSAAPLYLPPGSNLTFGEVTHTQRIMSAGNNPAAAAAAVAYGRKVSGGEVDGGMAGTLSVGFEYGNVQDLFDTIDELARRFEPTDPTEGGGGPGQDPDQRPPGGIDIGNITDPEFPELRRALETVTREVVTQLGVLAIISTEGYARAFVSADMPFLIGKDKLGGSWTFRLALSGTARAAGIADDTLEFDPEAALQDLERQIREAIDDQTLAPGRQPVLFDVVGDVDFTVDPNTNRIRAQFDNDSLLLTKSSQTTEVSVGYSRSVIEGPRGRLFVGAEGKLYDLALSRVSVRFGDITDSEELFRSIRNADSRRDANFGVDLGALWVGRRYQVGTSLTNVNEPTFRYPKLELTPYHDPQIIRLLTDDEIYTMERQLKLEASVFSENRRWGANFGVDANAVFDPVGEEFQWVTVSGGWTTDTDWVPNIRFGYRRNLVGTEVRYLSAGIQLFRFFNLDIASSLDTVSISGNDLPRGLMLNLGFAIQF